MAPERNASSTSTEPCETGIVHESTCVIADASLHKNKRVMEVCRSLVNSLAFKLSARALGVPPEA